MTHMEKKIPKKENCRMTIVWMADNIPVSVDEYFWSELMYSPDSIISSIKRIEQWYDDGSYSVTYSKI